jgi:hypothetical protein
MLVLLPVLFMDCFLSEAGEGPFEILLMAFLAINHSIGLVSIIEKT